MTTAPVGRVIRSLAVPTIISMLVTSIYNMVDTYFVGMINTQATAAVGIVFPLMSVIQAIGFFFGQGSGTYISRALGRKEAQNAQRMATTGFSSAFLFGILITAVGLLLLEPLSRWLGSTPTILPYTMQYMGAILVGAPFMTASMVLNNQMRFQGNAAKAMYGMMTGAALNVILVPIFTFTLGMGILGTGIATVLAQIVAFFTLLYMSMKDGNISPLSGFKSFKADVVATGSTLSNLYFEIFKGGTPSLTRQALASLSTIALNVVAGYYGDAAIAGMSIVTRVTFVAFAAIIGIGQGFQPLCGFNYGAGLYQRVKDGYFYGIRLSCIILVPICLLSFIFAPEIIDWLRHDPEVVKVGAAALRWQVITLPLAAVITISNMALQTSGKSLSANILAACRNGLCFLPLIILLPLVLGLQGVIICQTVADVMSFVIAVILIRLFFKELDRPQTSV